MSSQGAVETSSGDDTPSEALAITELARGDRDAAVVDRFLRAHHFPIVEGAKCTFVYRGAADEVHLRHGVFGLPSDQPLDRLPNTDLWYLVLDLPEKSRIEYKFEVRTGDSSHLLEDPLNPQHSRDPFGTNSVCQSKGYRVPEWTQPDPDARKGRLEEWNQESDVWGRPRHFSLYLPARFRENHQYPLMVTHDGGDFLNYASMQTVLDNLIHRMEIPEIVVALLHPDDRLAEYADDERHSRFLTTELIPRLERELPLIGSPRGRCLMGASFGAVAAFSTAIRNPGMFGRLLLQSGSFAFTDIGPSHRGEVFEPVVEMMNEFRARPTKVTEQIFMSCGTYESLIYENRSLLPLLQATGMDVRFTEANDGHNWENWRDRLREGLSWLFPGPLWMVYE